MNEKHNEFIKRLYMINPNIKVNGIYSRAKDKLEVECLLCENIWIASPNKLLGKRGCPKCADNKRKLKLTKSHDDFVKDVYNINPNIEVISRYINSQSYVELICKECGHTWKAKPGNVLSGKGCPICVHRKIGLNCRKTHDEFINRLKTINRNVEVLSEYKTSIDRVKCKCLLCKNVWYAAPKTLLVGKGCPVCNSSKGEIKIFEYLQDNNIEFIYQKSFDGLFGVGGNNLSYDFYIPSHNLLIEYQGRQHEMPVDFNGYGSKYAEKEFDIQIEHDKRKKDYALLNNIKLLEIWYWDFDNIEEILKDKLEIGGE